MLKSLLLATIITTSFTNIEANHMNRLARLSQNNINRRTLQLYDQNPQLQQNQRFQQNQQNQQNSQVPVKVPCNCGELCKMGKGFGTCQADGTTCAVNIMPPDCGNTATTTAEPTTTKPPTTTTIKTTPWSQPDRPCTCDKMIGNQCYCKVVATPNIVYTGSTGSKGKRSKGKHSKGKHSKGKHSKGKPGNSLALAGLGGIGDCDCEGGQITLALMYQGTGMVNIEWYIKAKKKGGKSGDANSNNGGTLICSNFAVKAGDEILCDTQNPSAPGAVAVEKLGTETLIVIKDLESNANKCSTSIHTSCSQDIVGYSYCQDSGTGVMDIVVTGWKDKNNLFDGLECGYTYEKCDCMV